MGSVMVEFYLMVFIVDWFKMLGVLNLQIYL